MQNARHLFNDAVLEGEDLDIYNELREQCEAIFNRIDTKYPNYDEKRRIADKLREALFYIAETMAQQDKYTGRGTDKE